MLPKKAGLQTLLHSQAPSHPNGQWRLCLGAITEFTAAGQSGILTRFTKWTFSRLSRVQMEFDSTFDLRKRSQLSTAKCTFTGDSFQNHTAKVQTFFEKTICF